MFIHLIPYENGHFPFLAQNGINFIVTVCLDMEIFKVDALARQKNSKRHFLKDIENSYHQVTHIGLEPQQFFSF